MFFKYSRTVIRTETRQTGKLKNPLNKMISGNKAVPEVIRTPDLPLRRGYICPLAECWAKFFTSTGMKTS